MLWPPTYPKIWRSPVTWTAPKDAGSVSRVFAISQVSYTSSVTIGSLLLLDSQHKTAPRCSPCCWISQYSVPSHCQAQPRCQTRSSLSALQETSALLSNLAIINKTVPKPQETGLGATDVLTLLVKFKLGHMTNTSSYFQVFRDLPTICHWFLLQLYYG